MRRIRVLVIGSIVLAACAGGGDPTPEPEVLADEVTGPGATPDYSAQLEAISEAPDDSSFPDTGPSTASGVYGFSRYVWTGTAGGVVPLLVEGPLGQQTRCQDVDLPCSYQDLRALADGGGEPPDALGMSVGEVGELVAQLDALNAFIEGFETMDDACAAGYAPETEQNPNMGIHMTRQDLLGDGFDPGAPEMLLWAKEDGELIPRAELGTCDGDQWTGEAGFEVVGAAFLQPVTPDHPEAFVGPIDNWHIHYSACSGATSDAIQGDEQSCVEAGGVFFERTPVWMMHAYVADGFDNQQGVFSMYNDSIWPLGQDLSLANQQASERAGGEGVESAIVNFDFGQDLAVEPGEPITFTNTDSLPHTVTAGLPGAPSGFFDSGVLGSGGAYTTEFDDPGSYQLFCALHPQMTATVTVEE